MAKPKQIPVTSVIDCLSSLKTNVGIAELVKSTIATELLAASLLFTGCGKTDDLTDKAVRDAPQSLAVAYATVARSTATNVLLTVTEIWKSSEEASRLGITNGMQFSEGDPAGRLPEGAIYLLSSGDTNGQTLKTWTEQIIWIRSGRVENMTVQEFRTKLGL